jgi:cytochrome c553
MRDTLVIALVLAPIALPGASMAADSEAGKTKAALCVACHGANGEGKTDPQVIVPALACQTEAYLAKAMQAYKAGTRQDPGMTAIFQALSEEDIANLAAYYSTLRP